MVLDSSKRGCPKGQPFEFSHLPQVIIFTLKWCKPTSSCINHSFPLLFYQQTPSTAIDKSRNIWSVFAQNTKKSKANTLQGLLQELQLQGHLFTSNIQWLLSKTMEKAAPENVCFKEEPNSKGLKCSFSPGRETERKIPQDWVCSVLCWWGWDLLVASKGDFCSCNRT